MNKTLLPIRAFFIALCAAGGCLVCYSIPQWDQFQLRAGFIGFCIGILVVLTDILLKGFSLRGLSAISFGLLVGTVISYMVGHSPLFAMGDPQTIFLVQLTLYIVVTYLCTVIALRGKDEFNLVIPYVLSLIHI